MANQASAASSSSAPSCPASTSYPHYDVFINHRGPDVKNTFAAYLYRRLRDNGLQVFLDKPEMLPGHLITPQILAAIEVASLHIAIFSPGYAQSKWCLDELELMLKTTKRVTNRATILPVFYNVKPSDLRYTTKGAYAEALLNHEKKARYDSSTIQNWRNALSYAADISGFELDGDEEELFRNVVEGVLKNVSKLPLYVAKYPTGLEEKLQDFEMTMLNEHKGRRTRAKVVGIVGFGGVGKTTLAKEFFNRNRSHYNESSFLLDVREKSARGSLNYLQTKLIEDLKHPNIIEDLKHPNIKIESPDEGIEILKRNLSSCQALVILDDVDSASQLEMLLPVDILSAESLILVTTRDKHVLKESGVSSIYNLTGLNASHSKELFCSYAFNGSLPPPEFTKLVDRFVTACNGLPLSLKVIGALLCGENEEYWGEQFNRLRQTLPEEIQKRLRISYDSLSKQDQPIFLDIACFFIREDKDRAIRIWGLVGIRNLENKCLLEVDIKNKIRMHDHIRDCARSIAEEESMPRRLRYQTPTNVMDALLDKSSSVEIEVRGITTIVSTFISDGVFRVYGHKPVCRSTSSEMEHIFNNSDFRGMKNLRFVATEGASVETILRRVHSPELTWLRWYGCPCSSLPDWIPMKNLRVLEVAGEHLKSLWPEKSQVMKNLRVLEVEGEHLKSLWPQQYQGPLELRELSISAPLSDIPKSIGQLKHLEWIHISAQESNQTITLETLPAEFCHLRSLKYLVLEEFSKLMSLPDSFGNLTNLQHINLVDASSLQRLPNSFGNLTRLKYLCLRGCSNLTISSKTLANIVTLEYLDLQRCSNVKELPPQVSYQRSLKELYLQDTNLKELLSGIGDLCNLEVLEIGNDSLEVLPRSLGNLKSLKRFSVRHWAKGLPDSFGMLTQLRELLLECSEIEYLPHDLLKFNNLEILRVFSCPLLELPFKTGEGEAEGGGAWSRLDSTNDKCMFRLNELSLAGTKIMEVTFPKGVCPNIQDLLFGNCQELRQIGGLCGLAKLKYLRIRFCVNLEQLASLENLKSLKELELSECKKLKSIQGLAQLTKLRWLGVDHCSEIEGLPGMEHCTSLEHLSVSACSNLKSIPGLGQFTKLEWLDVSECHEIVELPCVEHCMSLQHLDASNCPMLKSIPELGKLKNIGTLNVSGCHEIQGLPGMENCMLLEYLNASKCSRLKSIQGLGQLRNLTFLDISGCYEIEGLPGVEHCMLLHNLFALECPKLKSIPWLGQLTKLLSLDVRGCHEIEGLPGVEHCTSLKHLNASDCPKLRWGGGVLQQLRHRLKGDLWIDVIQYKRR